jgi:hypothetical protein
MPEDLLRNYQAAFSTLSDHEFANIAVLEADEQDCQKLFSFLRTGPYPVEIAGDEQRSLRSLPEQVDDFLACYPLPKGYLYSRIGMKALRIDKECLDLYFNFYGEGRFDIDLDQKRFQDETTGGEQIARLHDFIRTIGHLLNKVIILTPQALIQFPLFRFDPKTGEEHWFLEHTETME